jgi:serine/threonine-protein kinase HipA
MELLYQRALFAWLIADGDMHLKNLGLLKIADAGATRFTSVRLAPVYDAVTTRVFPRLEHDRMAFKLNGKDNRLTPDDFYLLARTLDIPQQRAAVLLANCARRVVDALPGLQLPALFSDRADPMLARVGAIIQERAEPFI